MGILRQEVKTASRRLPNNQRTTRFQVCLRRPERSKLRWRGNKLPSLNTQPKYITNEKHKHASFRQGSLNSYTETRTAYIEVAGKRIRIRILLDSRSNIFVINKDLVEHFDLPNEPCRKALNILALDGEVNFSGGKHYTHPILLEIGNNGHRT